MASTNSCKHCNNPATITTVAGKLLNLCNDCYLAKVRKTIKKNIPKSCKGKTIGIAVSGGKDSLSLLDALYYWRTKFQLTIHALSIDEGVTNFAAYRDSMNESLMSRYPEVIFHKKSFKENYGYSLDELVRFNDQRRLWLPACTICSNLRRHSLNQLCNELNLKYLFTGVTLNDVIQVFFINILRGTPELNQKHLVYQSQEAPIYTSVKPLAHIDEDYLVNYSSICQFTIQPPCPYQESALRAKVKKFLADVKQTNPGVLFNIYKTVNMTPKELITVNVKPCSQCHSFTYNDPCSACRMLNKLTLQ